ncbi:hypothetical protein DQ04_02981020 [Trypanosoma grayi]|uniref:hypothetical protein n=1 Tax=Trypanosoma grayi TaxID=71804 RepID=UPI0004F47FE4|nr:hypothetical protein DQ04_02981020 [Trypanosoma grayi]KEG11097.1 hypothetical protein DQ04_02981020 [Trypanosoma grayi]
MPPKQQAKKQRVRVTNKALEARQFSTVRLPRKSEVHAPQVDVARIYEDRAQRGSGSGSGPKDPSSGSGNNAADTGQTSSLAFDPIPKDPMFVVVAKSKYWPPPPLAELQASSGVPVSDGFDTYDRREDDKQARKEHTKMVRGELNHPRGKPRQNTLVKLDDSDEEGKGEGTQDSD